MVRGEGVDMKWYDYMKRDMENNYNLLKQNGNYGSKIWIIYVRGEILLWWAGGFFLGSEKSAGVSHKIQYGHVMELHGCNMYLLVRKKRCKTEWWIN